MENPAPDPPAPSESPTTFSLRGRPGAITLEDEGLHHPAKARSRRLTYTRYADITHLATSPRAMWLGARRSVYVVARRAFVDTHGPEHLVRALLERIARLPEGSAQLARMADIEETARTVHRPRATWGLALLCGVVYALFLLGGQDVHTVGYFTRVLATQGEWWRLVTANLLHAGWLHLGMNVLGLLAVGVLVEHSLGTARTLCVIVASAVGGMFVSAFFTSVPVVGVSGVVFGLVGALVWLELRFADALPAWWRVPRRALFWLLALSALLSLLPFIAGAAHAGGFAAGAASAALLADRKLGGRPSPKWLRALAATGVAFCATAVLAAGYELLREGEYRARYVALLGTLPDVTAEELNLAAWDIAINPESSTDLLESALGLAERAVEITDRGMPHILDTLAELYFQLDRPEDAVATIDEAIEQEPDRVYFREQRRRFLGERPEYPGPWEREELPPAQPGITV